MVEKRISLFESDDKQVSRAIELISDQLTVDELDSFYVGGIDKDLDLITITPLHFELMNKIKEEKKEDDQWVVIPPLSSMPNWTKQYKYSTKDDLLIKDSEK